MDVKHCAGCLDNFYNRRDKMCWMLRKAKLATRFRIATWQKPTDPGSFTEMTLPTCYRQKGQSFYDVLPPFVKLEDVVRHKEKR